MKNDFLQNITAIIEENLSNEQFGVSELADQIGMSRSNLLRKVKKLSNLSVSQFIRNIRLQHAHELLQDESITVSEVSYKVGFGSPSYFIKCFGEYFGYPPGESIKHAKGDDISQRVHFGVPEHQLAAIMFTDIEGYTFQMQKDEEKAVKMRNRHREVFKNITEKFNGKILQYFGDGTLSTFKSAIDAVNCGIELQLSFNMQPRVPVRIGIHSGDVIFNEEGIIGDGVNVASRIESLACAGSVLISEKIYDEVKNQTEIKTFLLGTFSLKNVEKSVEIYAISNPGLAVPNRADLLGKEKIINKGKKRTSSKKINMNVVKWVAIIAAVAAVIYLVTTSDFYINATGNGSSKNSGFATKSIAVLPFINDSNDSTNVYFINGLMESTLNNLQKIKDLRVISRTSVEKYRYNPKTTPEIARELDVSYIIEGSGQKIGDQIMLNIQLIDANTDKHLWAEQYSRKAEDIFALQSEVAKNIADKIQVIITPEVEDRIDKVPTDNLVAYDYFLKGLDILNKPVQANLESSIPYFLKAIQNDNEFARAYAATAMAYYFLDNNKVEKKYSDSINYYADKALFYDSQLPQSLIAKALFYMTNEEYTLAVPYFEKALEFNPNYDLVFVFLIDLYVNHIPDSEKYLEYALRGLKIDISIYDSTITSINYLHISNAFIQNGFIDEAITYIDKSLEYDPENLYSAYTKAYILFAKNRDLKQTRDFLLAALAKDTTRLDIMQEVAKIYYYLRDYENSYKYYRKFVDIRKMYKLDIYRSENAKIAWVFSKIGQNHEAEEYMNSFKTDAENDPSIYKHISLAIYYSSKGMREKAIEELGLFSKQNNYFYWTVIFTPIEPLLDNIKELPEFKNIMKDIENKFQANHKRIKTSLEKKRLI